MKLYTLEEARRIELRRSHNTYGHEWNEHKNGAGDIYQMTCSCGAFAVVEYRELPEGREVSDD